MEIKDLQYFIAIGEAGSFTAAAERLYISQQGLSSAIKRLEAEVGYPLLTRGPSGVAMTERGAAFYRDALPIVASFREFSRTYTGTEGKPSISIACAHNIISVCPRQLQRLLLNRESDYNLQTSEYYTSEVESLVENGSCSFGICYGPNDQSRFSAHPLFRREQCFIVNKSHPLADAEYICVKQLENEPLIIPSRRSRTHTFLRMRFRESGFEPTVVLECDRQPEIFSLVKSNPELVARLFEEDALYIRDPDIRILYLKDVDFSIDVCLIEKRRRSATPIEMEIRRTILRGIRAGK